MNLSQGEASTRVAMMHESRTNPAAVWLNMISELGPNRVANLLVALTAESTEYDLIDGQVRKRTTATATRGLNQHHNRRLKEIFKSAALRVKSEPGLPNFMKHSCRPGGGRNWPVSNWPASWPP